MTRIRIRIGLGATIVSPTRATSPTIQSAGWIAATIRPPSSGEIGARLKRLRKKPVNASATSSSESKYSPRPQAAAAPRPPRIGPAIAIFASFQALSGSSFSMITAPRKGMNIGAETGSPSRLASRTWPSSWTSRSTTKPIANCQPQKSAYAAIEMSIEPATVKILNLKIANTRNFSFQNRKPTAAIGAQSFRPMSRR